MGVAHAKESFVKPAEMDKDEMDQTFGGHVRVDRINVVGLRKTKDDIVKDSIRDLLKATNFPDVIQRVLLVKHKLGSLGCFKRINVVIDTSSGPKATKDGLEVTFNVRELRWYSGSVNTAIGNNEGSLQFGFKFPNLFGRGELIQSEYSYGTKKTNNFHLQFVKPMRWPIESEFMTSLYQHMSEWPWSGYTEVSKGFLIDYGFHLSSMLKHNLQYDISIRDLSTISRTTSFAVREQCGPSLKSSLRHILSLDQRDQLVFPTIGSLMQVTSELAGFGGNIGFLKNELFVQTNYSVLENVVVQATLKTGFITPTSADKRITMNDELYLGGPLSLRGFENRGIGPHSDGNSLGSDVCVAGGLHLFAPLPFNLGRGGIGEYFRTHLFVNAGNVGRLKDGSWKSELQKTARMSYGIGLAVNIGHRARMELNYCIPFAYQRGDRPQPGVQFGIGLQFL